MAYKFNHESFFNRFRVYHNGLRPKTPLTSSQVAGLEFLLTQIANDEIWQSIEHIAYALATTMHETAFTFQPISEYGSLSYFERRYGWLTRVGKRLGNDAPGDGAKYHGRGDVQLTGETNYERLELDLRRHYPQEIAAFENETGEKFDLTDYPNQAKNPRIAYLIMAFGMYHGRFTGKDFNDFAKGNYVAMRAIINGNDAAQKIAEYARQFEKMLKASLDQTGAATFLATAPAQDLSKPVELPKIEATETGATTAFDAIKKYAQVAAKATGITSLAGCITAVAGYTTGIQINPVILTYIIAGFVTLVILAVIFGGAALTVYVMGRFVVTALREHQAYRLNLAQLDSVANTNKQAVTFMPICS